MIKHYNKFSKTVDMRSRNAMAKFLSEHFRYYTLNSWNRATSWANNVKIYTLDLPKEITDKLYDMLNIDYWGTDLYFDINNIIRNFEDKTGYSAGFNGRSDGYIVLYDTEWVDGKRKVYPGRTVDDYLYEEYMDRDEFDMQDLRDKVKLVQAFDELCNNIIDAAVYFAENYDVVEEEYTEIKKRKVLREAI